MNTKLVLFLIAVGIGLIPCAAEAQELIVGEGLIEPGISVIFEGAIKDDVTPASQHLAENETDVHLEVRINWATDEAVAVPAGAVRGGFVPYLHVHAVVVNERTGAVTHTSLIPHVNLVDNAHYARNIALPGAGEETYQVTFHVHPPDPFELALHRDWRQAYGSSLFEPATFAYDSVDFSSIVGLTRSK